MRYSELNYILILELALLFSGCVTTSKQAEKVNNPIQSMMIRQQLNSNENIKYFNEIQKNNRDAWIYLK